MNTLQWISAGLLAGSLFIMMRGFRPRFREYRINRAVARWIREQI